VYKAASETDLAKKASEHLATAQKHVGNAYDTVAANPVVQVRAATAEGAQTPRLHPPAHAPRPAAQVVTSKGSEAAEAARAKMAEQLGKMHEDAQAEEASNAPAGTV
jgi:hypothetical protein